MRKPFITLLLALVALTGWAQVNPTTTLQGSWSGKLKAGVASLTVVLHLEQADGYVKVTLDSPDQGVKGIPTYKEYLTDDSLAVKMEQLNATYRARLKDGKLDGTFSQMGMSFPLVLERGMPEVKRPQMPKPPYPYETEEVTFVNKADSATLAGTLTWPVGYDKQAKQKPIVVLFVSGSGQQNRDEELMNHKPFLVIADYFARRGIAVLRYDDRGVGRSTGDAAKATTLDFADDAEAAFTFLRKHKRIDSKRVGIVGHSEGALIAQIVAARCRKVSFVAFLGGQGCSGAEVLLQQNRSLFALQGVADSLIDLRLACMREFFNIADTIDPKGKMIPALQEVVARVCPGMGKSELEAIGMDKKSLFVWSQQLQLPWFKTFLKLNPAEYLPKVRCRILALGGEKDLQVPAKENLEKIKALTSGKADTRLMPSLNHLFQHCTTGSPEEYLTIEETISPEVLEILANWILEK